MHGTRSYGRERLPDVDGVVDPDLVTVAPDEGTEELLSTLGGSAAARRVAEERSCRLVGLARVVLPRLVCGYGYHLQQSVPVSDAPVVRALRLALRDEIEDWQAVELMVQSLIRRPHDVAVVTAHQQRLEALVAGAGPVSSHGQADKVVTGRRDEAVPGMREYRSASARSGDA